MKHPQFKYGVTLFAALLTHIGIVDALWGQLSNTRPLTGSEDRSAAMVAGIHRSLDRMTDAAGRKRPTYWQRDFSSPRAYQTSVQSNRNRLREILGVVDPRVAPVRLQYVSSPESSAIVAENDVIRIRAVRWTVLERVHAEGLLLEPVARDIVARVVVLPDAGQTPEVQAGIDPSATDSAEPMARRLAEAGCQVLVPTLIDRQCQWSGNPEVVMTDQTHREWIYRQACEMGRHIIGYEVQKVLAAVDWFEQQNMKNAKPPIGVAGYGEGGLLALYSGALDGRIQSVLVSGYFGPRDELWQEPIYRNVFRLTREFGDAELASLIYPRDLVVEYSVGPEVPGPPKLLPKRRACAAPGRLTTPAFADVQREVARAVQLAKQTEAANPSIHFVSGQNAVVTKPGSTEALARLLAGLDLANVAFSEKPPKLADSRASFDPQDRQRRQVEKLVEFSQRLVRRAESIRGEYCGELLSPTGETWPKTSQRLRDALWKDVVGRLPDPDLPINPRSRVIESNDRWTMHEIVLDVWDDVFAWGYLILPNDLKEGERRPVVVCQHGLEGLPESVVTRDESTRGFRAYRAFAVKLAEQGYITFAPHNPYRGKTAFRQIQRKANPLGLTLYSFILGQHQRILQWLKSRPEVDADRIAFYGLSYGGLSAVRIPSLLDDYCLSICSACFNDWTRKITSVEFPASYMFHAEYDHFTFGLGARFNHAELAALIAPRPFMVERGHDDRVAPDEWVAHEFAKVRRLYSRLHVPEKAEIEFFTGGHVIHGEGTFRFLHKHLQFAPAP